ncbi:SDR family NAD(P)-dependent oxidoreductase [Geodermatophilus sabuli]|uniref:3-oxoacyl-[acyl-carrier protein] reductase n=1 Tax=Geodermatophilus sabuli TaxID=1564158 RepID=A0A285EAM7_9ACTN|nr:glucose 1-dehydrogenase [Geodermatophilus sabuli]MBB3082017.1 NAD(P)-dependent dehydrogenase (short-subunit alcohol dehydrogenase family) [Geodermatophilus sabuli]SNX95111.1 3-oxoacyl-[acyl-carrier protein] reductase [Geodermatophilus sabuli]
MSAQRVALVTGCGKPDGMGQAIARTLAAQGLAVVVTDLHATGVPNRQQEDRSADWGGVEALVAGITATGGTAASALGDVAVEADAQRMVAEAVERFGRLDVLVNNAAAPQGPDRADVADIPVEVFDRVIAVNLRGPWLMSSAAVPVMRAQRSGRIVNISSMAGLTAAPFSGPYSASKAGVIGLTRALAMDLGPWGITVNALCPGLVGTSRAFLSSGPDVDEAALLASRGRNIPVGRVGLPDDIAAAVAFLASPGAGYITGQAIPIDGGGMSPFPLRHPEPAAEAAVS